MPEPEWQEAALQTRPKVSAAEPEQQASLFTETLKTASDKPGQLEEVQEVLDQVVPTPTSNPRARRQDPQTKEELLLELNRRGLRAYPRKLNLAKLGRSLKTEEKPELDDMSEISRAVASRLVISDGLRANAVKAALNRIKEIERHTELTTGEIYTEEIQVFTDRSALARQAMAALRELPQAEEADYKLIVQVLASRLRSAIDDEVENFPVEAQPTEAERTRLARDAAHWVVLKHSQELREAMFSEIAGRAKLIDAKPLPDVMVCQSKIVLELSAKNIYGVLPPSCEEGEKISSVMMVDDRAWLADKTYTFEDGAFSQGQYDGTWFGNNLENAFSRALDRTDYVVWWHRNPRNKPYAVRVVRAEHDNYFYPDFVVCIRHNPADEPIARLLETKDDTKDASGKSKHSPASYGKVLFLTPDGNRMGWVNDDGSMGAVVDFDDMQSALGRLAQTRPVLDATQTLSK